MGWLPDVRAKITRTTTRAESATSKRAVHVPVRRLAARGVADEQAHAEENEQPRHGGGGESGDLGEREGDVGEGAEHAAVAEDGDQDGEPDLAGPEGPEFPAQAAGLARAGLRDQGEDADQGQHADGL